MKKRYVNSTPITVGGETRQVDEWAALRGCPVQTILSRIDRGWSEERAVTESVGEAPANAGSLLPPEILLQDEIDRLLQGAPKTETAVRDRAIITVSYRAGLRCCEVLRLQPKDLDQATLTIRILRGKGNKSRTVAIDPKGWEAIEAWIQLRATWPTSAKSPFFCTRQGGPINSRQVRAMMQRRGKRAELEKHTHLHGLRHTMASEMAAEGVPLMDIKGALGHANVATTNRYLQVLAPTSVLDAMKRRTWGAGSRPRSIESLDQVDAALGPFMLEVRIISGTDIRVLSRVAFGDINQMTDFPSSDAPIVSLGHGNSV